MVSTQALSDEVGEETAFQRLAPHYLNAALAASQNLPNLLNIQERTLEASCWIQSLIHHCTFKSKGFEYHIRKNEIVSETVDCCTCGNNRLICKIECDFAGRIFSNGFCPGMKYGVTSSLGDGDTSCRYLWKRQDMMDGDEFEQVIPRSITSIQSLNRLYHDLMGVPSIPYELTEEVIDQLSRHFLGEMWTFTIKAYIDLFGGEHVTRKLSPYMRHSGMSMGLRFVNQYGIGSDHESIMNTIKAFWLVHHEKSKFDLNNSSLECTIEDCPFKDGPVELCNQYRQFFNGLLETMNPDYEFSYDHMMTMGEGTCHWTIRKKGLGKEDSVKGMPSDDLVLRLTNRFIDGEITEEEYERKLALLRKHDLVK